jgi:superfamily I DNA and RNA helicase
VNIASPLRHLHTAGPPQAVAHSTCSPAVAGQADPRGAKLKEIERAIANLDRWQKAAAIESPEGPQRIRGLAGSGKTVVLALKAAYWHAQNPDWIIAVTFHSRALYQQFADLITRFSFEHNNDQPDVRKLQVMHSWGSSGRPGVYSTIAAALGQAPLTWADARDKHGVDGAFQGACRDLLEIARSRNVTPIFDAVLIDEAQDLPPEFFQLVYKFTREPKRIVWGYDELQKLSEAAMPSTDDLFGTGQSKESLVSLHAAPDSPRRDIILPVCYRNTPWALAIAHALGIGVYRHGGLLQHPDEPTLWQSIGYDVVRGKLEAGKQVVLKRRRDSAPEYFGRLLTESDAVVVASFPNEKAQDAWVAEQIAINLRTDELEPDDILVVLPDTYRAKTRAPRLMRELRRKDITCHLVGVDSSVDEVFRQGSVAIAHIFRAKGNEAPMVYAIDSQYAAQTFSAVTRRNTLFTAITRSRAWVRITGSGQEMETIVNEARAVINRGFELDFAVPTDDRLKILRRIHRDRSPEDEASVKWVAEGLVAFLDAFDKGEIYPHDLSAALQARLKAIQIEILDDDD